MLEKQNKYSIRKLTVGAASVLIGASFFAMNGKTVAADTVNDTNNANANKVVQESTGEKAPESTQDGLLKGTDKIDKNSSIESGTNANTSDAPANQDNPATKDSQHSGEADVSTGIQLNTSSNRANGTLQTSAPVKQGAPAIGTMQNQDNTMNNGVKVPETQTLNLKSVRNIKLNAVSLQDSKVQTQNATTNGGFDETTWGKLDVNSWKGQAENGVYQLTDYTGDLEHIIVPNAADFAAAGKDIDGLQVGIDADTTHSWFTKADNWSETGSPQTIAFSKTDNQKVKAIGGDWEAAFTGYYGRKGSYDAKAANLTKFDGNNLDISNITNMRNMFNSDQLTETSGMSNWDVSNVTDMSSLFYENKINNLSSLANWNVSSVTDMSNLFEANNISNLSPLANWNVSNVIDMRRLFEANKISDLSSLANWNVSNVTDMDSMFYENEINNLSPLASWNVSNVTDMSNLFETNKISDLSSLANWNVSNVTDMDSMFYENKISDLSPLANWHVNNVSMNWMFSNNQIHNSNPLANWTFPSNFAEANIFENNPLEDTFVRINFIDDNNVSQTYAPKDIVITNQQIGSHLNIDSLVNNPELNNFNLVKVPTYTVSNSSALTVHVTHKTSAHDASLPATRTICVHRPDGTTQTTVQTIGYKYTVTHDLVTNQDFNSEPIFDKDITETVVTTVDKNGKSTSQADKSTIFYTKASDGKYYNFNSFKLPTFPGYRIHMTAKSSSIEISYARQHLNAINFVDSTNPSNIVKTYNVSGFTGQTVATDISDNIPENWVIVPGSDYPNNITFSTNDQEDTPINVQVQRRYVDVTTGDGTTETLSRNIYTGKTDFSGSTVGEPTKIKTQTITLHRTGTKDLATGEVKWNPYSSGTFEAISAPTIPGYTLSNPNDCKPLTVDGSLITDGSSNVRDIYLIYNPNKHTQVFNYVDKNGTVEGTYSVDGYTDQTFPVASYVTNNIPSGWMQVPGSTYPLTLTFGPDDPAPINVQVQSRYANVTTGEGTTLDLHRDIYTDAVDFSGKTIASNQIDTQTITLHRTGTKDLVTGAIEWNPYSSGTFKAIIAPAMPGYTLMNPEDCIPMHVDGSLIVDGSSNVYYVHLIYRQDLVTSGGAADDGDMFTSAFVIMPTNSATNFAIMPTDSTSLTLPKIADSVQVTQSKKRPKRRRCNSTYG